MAQSTKMCQSCGERPRKRGPNAKYCDDCTPTRFPSQSREAQQARKFGISIDKLREMEDEQGGRCAICGESEVAGRRMAVDHDHDCCPGKESCGECVRGLLCKRCNQGLGHFRDDPKLLISAARYLEASRGDKY